MAEGKVAGSAGRPIPFIGVRVHGNRTAVGRRSSTAARRAARYFAYGRERRLGQAMDREAQRGEWYGPDGKKRSHEEVMGWIRKEALQHKYTFETILSVQEGALTAADFTGAMRQGGEVESWRLMVHEDTDYRHAHVLFFGDKRLAKEAFLNWQQRVREELSRLEERQLDGQAWQQETDVALDATRAKGWEVGEWT